MPGATACDLPVLSVIAEPAARPGSAVVATGKAVSNGVELAGARAVIRSSQPVEAWKQVVMRPELVDDWQPKEMGVKRSELIAPGTLFQQMDVSLLMGALRIQRQAVVTIQWLDQGPSRLRNCWWATDPTPWLPQVGPWVNDAPWNTAGIGGWDIRAQADGHTLVSYQFWAESKLIPPQVQAWGMSRTLPALMDAFERRVAEVASR